MITAALLAASLAGQPLLVEPVRQRVTYYKKRQKRVPRPDPSKDQDATVTFQDLWDYRITTAGDEP